ncbi:MAG: holo-ACP synthase [Gemmatimonadaceae bacterium]
MIVGVGIDLVDIGRVERMIVRYGDRALRRLFTAAEVAYATARAEPYQHLAARVAGKEAAFKALSGTESARTVTWHELEVATNHDGRPHLVFHGAAQRRADELGVSRSWITLTHSDGMAAAFVILEGH